MTIAGNIALIDLDRDTVDSSPVPDEWRGKFIGGWGIAAFLLCRNLPKGCDAASNSNMVVISTGLLGGTLSIPKGTTVVTSKSPQTGLMGWAVLGGSFASEMRQAGWDHIVISGRARKPVMLEIRDGRIHVRQVADDTDNGKGPIRRIRIVTTPEKAVQLMDATDPAAEFIDPVGITAILAGKNIRFLTCRGARDIKIKDPEGLIRFEKRALRAEKAAGRPAGGVIDALYKGAAGAVRQQLLGTIIARCLGYFPGDVSSDRDAFLDAACRRITLNTGLDVDPETLLAAAYRCITLERLYNIREGVLLVGKEDSGLSADGYHGDIPSPDPGLFGRSVAALYRTNGWTRAAVMKKGKVFEQLGIGELWPMFRVP